MTDQSSVFTDNTENPKQTDPSEQETPPQGQTQEPAPSQTAPSASTDNVFADQLASIQNDRGEPKYKDLPSALEALKHSQDYIPQVKQENESLKSEIERLQQDLNQRQSIEDTVGRLTAKPEEAPLPQETQGLTPEQVDQMLEQRLIERDNRQKAQTNAQQVEQAIVSKYGDKARDVVQAKSQEFGMSTSDMQEWATKNPKAVLALFEVQSTNQGSTPQSSSVNIPPIRPPDQEGLAAPAKSLLRGATSQEQMDYMRQVREHTYQRLGVNS